MKTMVGILAFLGMLALQAAEPVQVWHFDEGKGSETFDQTGRLRASLTSFPKGTQWVEGKSGRGVHISGTTAVRNSSGGVKFDLPGDRFVKPFSLELWFKLDKGIHYQETRELINAGYEREEGFRLYYYYRRFFLYTGVGNKDNVYTSGKVVDHVPEDLWHFLVVTYDGAVFKMYMNGELFISTDLKLTRNPLFTIGSYHGYAYPLNGCLDEMKIYDCPLTREEIIENYRKGSL